MDVSCCTAHKASHEVPPWPLPTSCGRGTVPLMMFLHLSRPSGALPTPTLVSLARSASIATFHLPIAATDGHVVTDMQCQCFMSPLNAEGPDVQLLNWQRRRAAGSRALSMYRIAPHSMAAPLRLVAKAVAPTLSSLDSRGAFILQHTKCLIIWQVCMPL